MTARPVRWRIVATATMVGSLLAACGDDETSSSGRSSPPGPAASVTPSAAAATSGRGEVTSSTRPSAATTPTASSTASTTPTTTPPTTAGTTTPTTVPGPPVYDPRALGDNLELPSFILTVTVANTNNGQTSENVTTTGFVDDPRGVYEHATFSSTGSSDGMRSYFVDGRSYEENPSGDWYLHEAGSGGAPDLTDRLDLRSGTLAAVTSARFDGPADVAGIAANHFVFDETDLANFSSYTPERPSPTVEGDFYLAQDGNHVLYAHSKETSPGRIYEVTEALSFVGAVAPIELPADLAPMREALDAGVALGNVLPPGSSLMSMIRYEHGIGVDYYRFRSGADHLEDFLAFYRTMPPTDGWSVAHVGHVKPHLEQIDCETSVECVILRNGGEQLVVSFASSITLEYDHEHVFSPL